jgi:hypothetical protein
VDTLKSIFVAAAKLTKVIPKNVFKPTNIGVQTYPKPEIQRRSGGVCGLIMVNQGKEKYTHFIKM